MLASVSLFWWGACGSVVGLSVIFLFVVVAVVVCGGGVDVFVVVVMLGACVSACIVFCAFCALCFLFCFFGSRGFSSSQDVVSTSAISESDVACGLCVCVGVCRFVHV